MQIAKKNSGALRRSLCPQVQNSVGAYEYERQLVDVMSLYAT